MAISLNNHESRITALEGSLTGGIVQTEYLYQGSSNKSITLSKSVELFDFIYVATSCDRYGSQEIIPKMEYGQKISTEFIQAVGEAAIVVKDNNITFYQNWNNTTYIKRVLGIKIAKTLYYKVLEYINRFFKEVIS